VTAGSLPIGEFPLLRSLAPVLAAYDGAAELERELDILLTGLTTTLPPRRPNSLRVGEGARGPKYGHVAGGLAARSAGRQVPAELGWRAVAAGRWHNS
jgi:hypothetical protein